MKYSLIYFAFVLSVSMHAQSNNIIFLGGTGEGSTILCFKSAVNNQIFTGAIADGYTSGTFTTFSNGNIFTGGIADGNASDHFLTISNGHIFAGGLGDGLSSFKYMPSYNNDLFSGGVGDGTNSLKAQTLANNQIFVGATGDGSNLGEYLLNLPTIIWHGTFNSDWNFRFNWNLNRIPTIEDQVIINTQVHDPLISLGALGVGTQITPVIRFARNLYVLDGSTLLFGTNGRMLISGGLNIYGGLESMSNASPVVSLFPQGRLHLFSNGFMNLRK